MTLNDKLKQSKKQWDIKSDYERCALPEVLAYNKQLAKEKPEDAGYIARILDFILSKEKIDTDLIEMLNTEIYLSNQDIDRENKAIVKTKMTANGFVELTDDVVKRALEEKKKVLIDAFTQNDWMSNKVEKTYKPFINNEGTCFLMPLKARSRGFYLTHFKDAYCKLV